jgi:hypothetical protein
MKTTCRPFLLATLFLIGASGLSAQPKTINPQASENAKAVLTLLQEFKGKREAFVAERKALIATLKDASEEDRKKILEALRAEQKERISEQRALAKAIREEMRAQRKKAGE